MFTEHVLGNTVHYSGQIALEGELTATVIVSGYVEGNWWTWIWHLQALPGQQPVSHSGGWARYASNDEAAAAAVHDLGEHYRLA